MDTLYLVKRIIPETKTSFIVPPAVGPSPPAGAAAWYKAYTNANLAVNNDGTGGVPADGANFGWCADLTANGNNLSAITGQFPKWRTGYGINCQWDPDDASNIQGTLGNITFSPVIPSLNCSGGIACDMPGSNATAVIDLGTSGLAIESRPSSGRLNSMFFAVFSGGTGGVNIPTLRPIGRKCVITWRSNGSNFILRVNGQDSSIAQPLASVNMSRVHFGTFNGGNAKPIRYYEMLIYPTDIGAAAIGQLENYLTGNIGTYDSARTVSSMGDSLAYGVGSDALTTVFDTSYISNRPNSLWYLFNTDGGLLSVPSIDATELNALKGANEGVVIMWIGTNDILGGSQTGAQTETNLNTYCTTLKAGGNKVIVSTLQAFVPNNAERVIFNNNVRANFATYADALVDLAANANLSDSTNLTFFETDGVHLTDAGYATAAGLYQTALASI